MQHINTLNANQLAKELQTYERYKGKTQKEIKEKIGNTNNLRVELERLERKQKSSKEIVPKKVENNQFTINGKQTIYRRSVIYHDTIL